MEVAKLYTLGFGLDAPLNEPYGLAVDAADNLWVSNSNASTLTEFVGLAQPIRTPLLGQPSSRMRSIRFAPG